MTSSYKILKWTAIAIVCAISAIVALGFVIGLIWFLNIESVSRELPTNMTDLQKLAITVKSAIITRSPQFIIPVEYPTHFTIDGHLPAEIVAKNPVNPGDHVDIYLTKKEMQTLENTSPIPAYMQGYGIALQDGEQLVDPDQFLNGKVLKRMKHAFISLCFGCLIYFASLAFFIIWRKRSNIKLRHR